MVNTAGRSTLGTSLIAAGPGGIDPGSAGAATRRTRSPDPRMDSVTLVWTSGEMPL